MVATKKVIQSALMQGRLRVDDEATLQQSIADALEIAGVPYEPERRLSGEDRIDFMCAGGLGIEVKIEGTLAQLTRQLHRYAQHDEVRGLIVVTSRSKLTQLPRELSGKPIEVVYTVGAAL